MRDSSRRKKLEIRFGKLVNLSMSKQVTRQATKQERRRDRREEERRRELAKKRATRNRNIILSSILAAVIIIGAVIFFSLRSGTSGQSAKCTSSNPAYPCVVGVNNTIPCDQQEQTAFHIHALVTIYINGKQVTMPQNIGIAADGSCLYWLHTHTADGVLHIEAPANHNFVLGDFFDIWGNQFAQLSYPTQLDATNGWQVYVDGKPYTDDFHKIALHGHTMITLAYNSPGVKPVTNFNWAGL